MRVSELEGLLADARLHLGKREDLENNKDADVALQMMMITLDPYTVYIDPEQKARADIERLVALAAAPDLRGKTILLLGFADSVGPYGGNASLSLVRATQVRDTLLAAAKGSIDPASVVHKGYSELAPVACNDHLEGRNLNRRVEVWVRD